MPNQPIYTIIQEDVTFESGVTYCTAWLFKPENIENPPVIILGHGVGGIKEMRLDAFAERFAQAGIAALAFTYRYLGNSGGEPRQLMDINHQLDDWEAAITYIKNRDDLDVTKIAVWGSSFGGGHAITIASRHPELKAAIAQCPFTDGLASSLKQSPKNAAKMTQLAIKDLLHEKLGNPPVMIPIAAHPGELALMSSPDALSGYLALMPKGMEFTNYLAARVVLQIMTARPGIEAANTKMPILFCVSNTDTVAPPDATLKHIKYAPKGTIKCYNAGHFDFYIGEPFEQLVKDQTEFLLKHLVK